MAVQKYGLDLGTGTIKIYKDGQGLVLREKNMIAIRRKTEMLAFGDEAYAMYERAPENIRVYSPVKNGVIAGLHDMRILLDLFLKKVKCTNGFIRGNEFYFAVPCDITEVEKRAFLIWLWVLNSNPEISILLKNRLPRQSERVWMCSVLPDSW